METSRLRYICLAAVVTVIIYVKSFGSLNSSSSASANEKKNLRVKMTKRLPDAIIIGVKKCGTTTLGQFLNYHPNIAATGEISFFENYKNYLRGPDYYIRQMPYARKDQVVLAKSKGVWYQKHLHAVLHRIGLLSLLFSNSN